MVEPRYGEIVAPTLIVWGEADPWIPAARGHELAEQIPGARLALLPDTGHLVQEDEPEQLTALLREHLER